jgi:stage V sporulation protein AB
MIWKYLLMSIVGLASGSVIAGGVFAFITIIGIVPRIAQRTGTEEYITIYETAITIGGILGATTICVDYYLPIGNILVVLYSLAIGMFIGCLAVALAETIDVIPILSRRVGLQEGIAIFIITIALGKMLGSILYYLVPGFYDLPQQ